MLGKNSALFLIFLVVILFVVFVIARSGIRKSAEAGLPEAQNKLGLMYEKGLGTGQDIPEAMKWFRKAADQNLSEAQFNLGRMNFEGRGMPLNHHQAARWYRNAAENGHPEAQFQLGKMHQQGLGVPQDYDQAVFWFNLASAQGFTMEGGDRKAAPDMTLQQVIESQKQNADRGNAASQFALGVAYANGMAGAKDLAEAKKWYLKAASLDDILAQYKLGLMHEKGLGMAASPAEAFKWYARAAEQGLAEAQFQLASMYLNGKGVQRNDEEAVKWFRKAADQGNGDAQFYLGSLYYNGQGIHKDLTQALFWFTLSAVQGYKNAIENREIVARGLPPQVVAKTKEQAHEWRPSLTDFNLKLAETGTGFAVNVEGNVLATNHLVAKCRRLQTSEKHIMEILAQDEKNDLALLKLREFNGVPALFRTGRALQIGEKAVFAWYPARGLSSAEMKTAETVVVAMSGAGNDARFIQARTTVQPLGGPLLDQAGHVIGMVNDKPEAAQAGQNSKEAGQNVAYALRDWVARSFMDANAVRYNEAPSTTPVDPLSIAQTAAKFTVAIECWRKE